MLWILFLMIHYVHSRPNDNPAVNTKHCIKMSSAKETEITNILAKFTDFLNKISEEHEDFDIPYINIHIENHSDDESDEKDTKFRVVINDCNDVVDRNDKSNKHVDKNRDKEKNREVTNKYIQATQDLPKNKTFLEINEELTKEIETLQNLLNDCNKFKAGVEEIRKRHNKFSANNSNNQFLASITDHVFTNDNREGSSREIKDNVVSEDKEITVTDKNNKNTYNTTQDIAVNENNFAIIDMSINKNVSDNIKLDNEEKGAEDYKDMENSNEITQKESPNNTHAEINTSATSNQWKVKFMKVIEKLLDDTVSNIQFIADNDNNSYIVSENSYIEKSKLYDELTFDDKEKVSIEHHNDNKNKNYFEINEDTVETEEKYLNHLNQNDESHTNTEMDNYTKLTNFNDDECENDGDEHFNANMKIEENNSKDENKRDFDLVTDKDENNFAKVIENSKIIDIEKNNQDTNIIIDTHTGNINDYVNLNTKDTETDNDKLTDIEHGIIKDKDYLQIINNADIISVNINNDDNNSHKHDKQEVSDKMVLINQINSKNANKPEVNETIDYLKDLNSNNNSTDYNPEINKNNQTGNSIIEYKPIDKEEIQKYNDESNEIVEELMSNLEQKVPEVLPLSLEENGEEMLQMLEKQRDKSKPLWVYIQEKNNQNEYVFFSKK